MLPAPAGRLVQHLPGEQPRRARAAFSDPTRDVNMSRRLPAKEGYPRITPVPDAPPSAPIHAIAVPESLCRSWPGDDGRCPDKGSAQHRGLDEIGASAAGRKKQRAAPSLRTSWSTPITTTRPRVVLILRLCGWCLKELGVNIGRGAHQRPARPARDLDM